MQELTHELEAYYAGTADAEQLRAVEAWIHADPANARALIEQIHFRELVGEHLRQQADNTASILSELAQFEANAESDIVTVGLDLSSKSWLDPCELSARDYLAASRFMLRHSLTPKVIASLATAATLLLGITLLIVLLSGNEPGIAPIANVTGPPESTPLTIAPIVAKLTATKDAQWESDFDYVTPKEGDLFRPGRQLTLLSGFAEITTQRGAVAILESPVTIEFLDDDNALRLHAGKLVGLCHTEASKGFVVKTDHAEITDLGTEFGVSASEKTIDMSVFVGEIGVATATHEPTRLQSNQGASFSTSDPSAELIVHDDPIRSFTRRLPRPTLVEAIEFSVDGLRANIEAQSLFAESLLYLDRDYRPYVTTDVKIPAPLLGGDIVQMPIDAFLQASRLDDAIEVRLTVSQPAEVYLLVPRHAMPGPWLERDYKLTSMNMQFKPHEASDHLANIRSFEIWQRRGPATGTSIVAGSLGNGSNGMYTMVVQPANQPPDGGTPDPIN